MKYKLYILAIALVIVGCADQTKRQAHLQSVYPNSKIEPATGMIQQNGFDFIAIDTTGQIIAASYYPFSETKIMSLRNIR